MKVFLRRAGTTLMGLLICAVSQADVILLTNGGRIEGTVVEKSNGKVTIEMEGGRVVFDESEITSVAKSNTVSALPEVAEERVERGSWTTRIAKYKNRKEIEKVLDGWRKAALAKALRLARFIDEKIRPEAYPKGGNESLIPGNQTVDPARQELAKKGYKFGPEGMAKAASRGDAAAIRLFLQGGAQVDAAVDAEYNSALIMAAEYGQTKVVMDLINAGAQVNAANRAGDTALHTSSRNGHDEAVKALLDSGAYANAANRAGYTPLILAATKNYPEIVELLLRNGSEIDFKQNREKMPAIGFAAREGNDKIVKRLIEAKANLNMRNSEGRTPLGEAIKSNRLRVAQLLKDAGAEK